MNTRWLKWQAAGLLGWALISPISAIADDDVFDFDRYRALRTAAEAKMRDTANQVHKDAEAQIKETESRLAEARKWTKAQFELSERDVIDKPKAMTAIMQRWQTQHERDVYQLLQFPERSGHLIESGEALNKMLDQVGAAAFQNAQTRKVNPDHALPLYEATEFTKVDQALADEVISQDNTQGPKLVRQGNRGPLELDWPSVLRDERWAAARQKVESARDRALNELGSTSGLSPEADADLRSAVAELNAEFSKYRADWIRNDYRSGLEYRRICEGTQHIRKLVLSAYQLVEFTSYQSVRLEPFPGGNIEDYLAYFHAHNLRFAPASPNHRSAYYRVFNMMVRYYLDQKAAANLERQLNTEISQLKAIDKSAIDVALGRTMSAADQAAIEVEQLKFVRALIAN
jgi:hypothetical protein